MKKEKTAGQVAYEEYHCTAKAYRLGKPIEPLVMVAWEDLKWQHRFRWEAVAEKVQALKSGLVTGP